VTVLRSGTSGPVDAVKGAQTADRAIQLLLALVEAGGLVSLRDLGELAGLNRAATYRLIQPLLKHGWVTRDARGGYRLGPGLIALSARVLRTVSIREPAREVMERIAALTAETVSLHVPHLLTRVCIDGIESSLPVRRVVPFGQSLPVYVGPTGKAMLAWFPAEQVSAALREAANLGLDTSRIREHLDLVRRDGYLGVVDDRLPGVGGLSVPIFGVDGIAGVITVSGPSYRFDMAAMSAIAARVVAECRDLSQLLGHSGAGDQSLAAPLPA
jgi:IclR family KDG regulon transcriptional repressor